MEIIYCKKCHNKKQSMHFDEAVKKIENITKKKVIQGCISSCGFGKNQYIAEYDTEVFVNETLDGLIEDLESEC